MRAKTAWGFFVAVLFSALLIATGIWWYRSANTLKDCGGILIYISIAICGLGGLISLGSGKGRYPDMGFDEHFAAHSEELRRINAENRQAGASAGLLVFLAGLVPGVVAWLIVRYL